MHNGCSVGGALIRREGEGKEEHKAWRMGGRGGRDDGGEAEGQDGALAPCLSGPCQRSRHWFLHIGSQKSHSFK